MVALYTNNAHGTFSAGISAVATTLTLDTGQGALFPNPGSADFFRVSLERLDLTASEIVYCTSRAGDVLTIVRAQEGTTGVTFSTADRVRLRPTAEMLEESAGALDIEEDAFFHGWAGQGAGAGPSAWGFFMSNIGADTVSGVATSSQQASIPGSYHNAALSTSNLGWQLGINQARIWRGNATNRGGFDIAMRWAIRADPASTSWLQVGPDDQVASGTTSPGTRTTSHLVVVGWDAGSAIGSNYFIFTNDGSGTPTAIDTGIARNTTSVMEARFYAPPNASYIDVTVTNLETDEVYTTSITTDMPSTSVFLINRFLGRGAAGLQIKMFGEWKFNVNQGES